MKLKATYFLKNKLLGESIIHDEPDIGVPVVNSIAYFCGTCGDVWARVIVEGSSWFVERCPCERHQVLGVQDWTRRPGSLLHSLTSMRYVGRMAWAQTIEALPNAALKREFLLHMAYKEKEDVALSNQT